NRPAIRVSPTASAPRINARCEIDLSPGTRAFPVNGPLARASSGIAGLVEWVKIVSLYAGRQVAHAPADVIRTSKSRKPPIDSGVSTSQVKHRFSEIPRIHARGQIRPRNQA